MPRKKTAYVPVRCDVCHVMITEKDQGNYQAIDVVETGVFGHGPFYTHKVTCCRRFDHWAQQFGTPLWYGLPPDRFAPQEVYTWTFAYGRDALDVV